MENATQQLVDSEKNPEAKQILQREMASFQRLFQRYNKSKNEHIDWSKINPPKADLIIPYKNLEPVNSTKLKELSSKLVVLKLNGGLGTTMGCVGPKSAIEVRGGSSFLDLTVKQIKVGFVV